MDYRFAHFNFNVLDMEKSLAFYKEALELEPVEEKNAPDGAFRIVYLGDPEKAVSCWSSPPCGTGPRPMTWGMRSSTWPSPSAITRRPMTSMQKWAASVLKIPRWAFTLFRTRTVTGSRSCPPANEVTR